MDSAIKEKWVKALRSGEYEQGIVKFERAGAFCCLGVLCKTLGEPTMNSSYPGMSNWNAVRPHLGDKLAQKLANMNDRGLSFPKIADYIEENL